MSQVLGHALYNQSKFSGLQLSQDHGQQQNMGDTLSAATAAITADPNFTAALAAAISTIIGGGGGRPNNGNGSNVNNSSVPNNTTSDR